MMFRPAGRVATGPFPPGDFAARFFAAVIRPPRLFLAMLVFFGLGLKTGFSVGRGEQHLDPPIAASLGVAERTELDAMR